MYLCKKLFDSVWQDLKCASENVPKLTTFLSISTFYLVRRLVWVWRCYWWCSITKGVLKNFQDSQENICVRVFFNKFAGLSDWKFIKKRLQHWFFFCEICEIFKNTYFEEHLRTTASIFDWSLQSSVNAKKLSKRQAEDLTQNICREPNPEEEVFDFCFD